jgi:hypothetical protein
MYNYTESFISINGEDDGCLIQHTHVLKDYNDGFEYLKNRYFLTFKKFKEMSLCTLDKNKFVVKTNDGIYTGQLNLIQEYSI